MLSPVVSGAHPVELLPQVPKPLDAPASSPPLEDEPVLESPEELAGPPVDPLVVDSRGSEKQPGVTARIKTSRFTQGVVRRHARSDHGNL